LGKRFSNATHDYCQVKAVEIGGNKTIVAFSGNNILGSCAILAADFLHFNYIKHMVEESDWM
jgi:hypothetical protein